MPAAAAAASAAATAAAVTAALAVQKELQRVTDLERKLDGIAEQLAGALKTLEEIKVAANRWKGGFLVVVALGGIITWFASIGGNVRALLR